MFLLEVSNIHESSQDNTIATKLGIVNVSKPIDYCLYIYFIDGHMNTLISQQEKMISLLSQLLQVQGQSQSVQLLQQVKHSQKTNDQFLQPNYQNSLPIQQSPFVLQTPPVQQSQTFLNQQSQPVLYQQSQSQPVLLSLPAQQFQPVKQSQPVQQFQPVQQSQPVQ